MKLSKESRMVTLIVSAKSRIFNGRKRAFKLLRKGIKENEPVINSKVHRSIK